MELISEKTRDALRNYFNTGDRPTESQFAELIESMINKLDDEISIDVNNNVGIGTTSPGNTLDVAGGIDIDDFIRHNGNENTYIGFSEDNTIQLSTAGTDRLTVDSGGNVGIGTTSPGNTLDVAGGIDIDDFIRHNGNENTYIGFSEDNTIQLNTAGTDRLTVDSGGNVGIGTTSPGNTLDVAGGIDIDDFIRHNGNGDTYIGFPEDDTIQLSTAGTDRLTVTPGGNIGIGIGTDSIDAKLHILNHNSPIGAGIFNSSLRIENPGVALDLVGNSESTWGASLRFFEGPGPGNEDTQNLWSIIRNTSGAGANLHIKYGDYNAATVNALPNLFTITPLGNVGIGTDSPATKLHVRGIASPLGTGSNFSSVIIEDENAALDIISDDSTLDNWGGGINLIEGGGEGIMSNMWSIYRNTTEEVGGGVLKIGYGEYSNPHNNPIFFRITTAGDVGIGTFPTDGYKLDINGDARADSFTPSPADYAEYFEAQNGNAIPVATAVTAGKDGKIQAARKGETPIGIVSHQPGILGNSPKEWPGKYLRDEFNQVIMEEYEEEEMVPKSKKTRKKNAGDREEVIRDKDGNPVMVKSGKKLKKQRKKLNPQYDETQEYILRKDREEWCAVGLLGQLPLRKGQPVAPTWVKLYEISDKADMWLVK